MRSRISMTVSGTINSGISASGALA